jgi:hypothetical protein
MFPSFGEFLKQLAARSPDTMIGYLQKDEEALSNFLPGILAGLGDRQIVPAVDHRFALSNPALVSAPSKKLISAVRAPCGVETEGR